MADKNQIVEVIFCGTHPGPVIYKVRGRAYIFGGDMTRKMVPILDATALIQEYAVFGILDQSDSLKKIPKSNKPKKSADQAKQDQDKLTPKVPRKPKPDVQKDS